MSKLLAILAFIVAPLSAEVLSWQDVEFLDKAVETGKMTKRDGMLHLDRDTGVVAFTSENKVYTTVLTERISRATYEDKNDRKLTLEYRDARDRVRTAEFKLKGGNRENILTAVSSETNGKLEKITKK